MVMEHRYMVYVVPHMFLDSMILECFHTSRDTIRYRSILNVFVFHPRPMWLHADSRNMVARSTFPGVSSERPSLGIHSPISNRQASPRKSKTRTQSTAERNEEKFVNYLFYAIKNFKSKNKMNHLEKWSLTNSNMLLTSRQAP